VLRCHGSERWASDCWWHHQASHLGWVVVRVFSVGSQLGYMSETNRIQFVLSSMQNRTSGPYLAAIDRIIMWVRPRQHCTPGL
jgi:hypothetical protein